MKTLIRWLPIIILAESGYCQDWNQTVDIPDLSDQLFVAPDEDLNYEELLENTLQIMASPLDLNTVSEDELRSLQVLTDDQIENILLWRAEHGPLLDVHELQIIPGLDRETIFRLLPFVKVIDPSTRVDKTLLRRILAPGNTYFVARYARTFEKKKGFVNEEGERKFAGSADQLYVRMRSSLAGDYSIGITGEKDEGEKFRFTPRQPGFDFTSMHLQLKNKGKLRNLILGDFQSQFAQGLVFGGAFGAGKGGEQLSTVRKTSIGFQPYTSIRESAYKRGAAVTFAVSKTIDVSLFYSNTRRDAGGADSDSSGTVSGVRRTGLHRTQKEITAMKTLKEQDAGLIVHFKDKNVDAGATANYLHFDADIRKKRTVYNQFSFNGEANMNFGLFLNYRLQNTSFFSEAATSLGAGAGAIAGLLISVHKKLDICVLYRYYAPDLIVPYSNAFSEGTEPQNERGFYWAWKYKWDRRASLTGYADLFYFPWLGFRRYKPSAGYEWFFRGTYQPARDVNIFMQLREESKLQNLPAVSNVYQLGVRVKRSVALNLDYGISKTVRLKSRLQYNSQNFDERTTEGWAFVQDINLRLGKLELGGRHGLFDTDHYDNRQYVYERDTWASYSMPAYAGVGVRNYALVAYKLSKSFTLWVRYTRTRMLFGGEIGTGDERIEGNTRNDVKFQARLTF